jgi:uncharacterized protein YukE
MGNLHSATERLQAALDRLEQAVEKKAAPVEGGDLRAALASARRENAELRKLARTVAERLDGTIDRLSGGLQR